MMTRIGRWSTVGDHYNAMWALVILSPGGTCQRAEPDRAQRRKGEEDRLNTAVLAGALISATVGREWLVAHRSAGGDHQCPHRRR